MVLYHGLTVFQMLDKVTEKKTRQVADFLFVTRTRIAKEEEKKTVTIYSKKLYALGCIIRLHDSFLHYNPQPRAITTGSRIEFLVTRHKIKK